MFLVCVIKHTHYIRSATHRSTKCTRKITFDMYGGRCCRFYTINIWIYNYSKHLKWLYVCARVLAIHRRRNLQINNIFVRLRLMRRGVLYIIAFADSVCLYIDWYAIISIGTRLSGCSEIGWCVVVVY